MVKPMPLADHARPRLNLKRVALARRRYARRRCGRRRLRPSCPGPCSRWPCVAGPVNDGRRYRAVQDLLGVQMHRLQRQVGDDTAVRGRDEADVEQQDVVDRRR